MFLIVQCESDYVIGGLFYSKSVTCSPDTAVSVLNSQFYAETLMKSVSL